METNINMQMVLVAAESLSQLILSKAAELTVLDRKKNLGSLQL